MTQLFVQIAQSVTGNVITIVALNLAAAIIGFIIAWIYAKSVFTPVIKGLETDKTNLNSQVGRLNGDLASLTDKVNRLSEKADKLENEKAKKDKEIKDLSDAPVNTGRYVISVAKNGETYFNLKATNGQIILTSSMFSSMDDCINGIETVRKSCSDDNRYERNQSANDKPYFNLKASNGQIIGRSEMYESVTSLEKGIASVKKNGTSTKVVEDQQ